MPVALVVGQASCLHCPLSRHVPCSPSSPPQPKRQTADSRESHTQLKSHRQLQDLRNRLAQAWRGQQAPRGSFARLLLSGGLWGLQPERGQTSHTSPTESSSEQQSNVESSRTRREHAAAREPEREAAKPLTLGKSESDPGQIRDSPSQQVKQPARVSLLAQGLAKDSKQQQPALPSPLNPFQSWSHLLPPVTTVKRTGPPSPRQPARR